MHNSLVFYASNKEIAFSGCYFVSHLKIKKEKQMKMINLVDLSATVVCTYYAPPA